MRRFGLALLLLSALLLAVLLLVPGPLDPASWTPALAPELSGPLAANEALARVELLGEGLLSGPEDVEVDAAGRIYTGTEDGTIRRFATPAASAAIELFTDTGGRPLGLDMDRHGTLWVADSVRGLVSVDRAGHATVRAERAGGLPVGYADDVDSAPGGKIYFSDASTRFSSDELHLEPLEARPWGRLIEYDPATGRGRVLLDDLYFANGVAVADDGAFVLVAETFRYRIRRYWLAGPRAGRDEIFADNLPGFPDGVSSDGRGGFWVAIFSPRVTLLDRHLHPRPWLKRLVARLPVGRHGKPAAYGLVLSLDAGGRCLSSLHDATGRRYPYITSVEEWEGVLYLGSTEATAVGRHPLDQQPG